MIGWKRALCIASAALLCLLVPPALGQGGPIPVGGLKKKCHGLVGNGTAPVCDGTACTPLGPYCYDPCTTLTYTEGDCRNPYKSLCTMENQTVDEETCRDCDCSTWGIGSCSVDGGPYPSGSIQVTGCRQGG
jgi:hypothetical protein